jgi:hypothetical protein
MTEGQRTGARYEVWPTRDELARGSEVLLGGGVGFINPAPMQGKIYILPLEICPHSVGAELRWRNPS